jgi:hypothetical protein
MLTALDAPKESSIGQRSDGEILESFSRVSAIRSASASRDTVFTVQRSIMQSRIGLTAMIENCDDARVGSPKRQFLKSIFASPEIATELL